MIKLPELLLHGRGLPYSQGDNLSPGWQCLVRVACFLSIIDIVLEQQVPTLDPGHSSDFITHYESINKTHNWHVYLGFQFLASSFWPPLQIEQMTRRTFIGLLVFDPQSSFAGWTRPITPVLQIRSQDATSLLNLETGYSWSQRSLCCFLTPRLTFIGGYLSFKHLPLNSRKKPSLGLNQHFPDEPLSQLPCVAAATTVGFKTGFHRLTHLLHYSKWASGNFKGEIKKHKNRQQIQIHLHLE